MTFDEVYSLVLKSCPYLSGNDYDGIIIKKLAATNTISDSGASHQSHMAFTGVQKDFFPFLEADGYFNIGYDNKDDDLKKYFTLLISLNIYAKNVATLSNGAKPAIVFESDEKLVKASVLRSRRKNQEDQVEMSIKSLDDKDFVEFRKLLHVNDFFVLLKRKGELLYDLVGIKGDDENAQTLATCTDFYKLASQTPVSIDSFETPKISNAKNKSFNRIVFGAPGTGKSHTIENDRKTGNFAGFERVTFHPNYSFFQFVGSYKPMMKITNMSFDLDDEKKHVLEVLNDESKSGQEKYDLLYEQFKNDFGITRLPLLIGLYSNDDFKTKKADGSPAANDNSVERNHGRFIRPYVSLYKNHVKDEEITYKYVPGPFMRAYVAAKKNPVQDYLLIIEEINRANVAAVFGDVFQLLDRKNGVSEYPIAASEDIKKYLKDNGIDDCEELRIPNNMYIWATMNSADQGVFPMDTAFKRRWEFEYIGIDDNADKVAEYEIPIGKQGDNAKWKVKWDVLRRAINDKLISLGINEDKLLGPFFLSKSILENALVDGMTFVKSFESKVLMYLFEDAARMKVRQLFKISSEKYIYSEVCREFEEKGIGIFDFKQAIEVTDITPSEG